MSASPPNSNDPLVGQRFGPYQLIAHIARGGLGTVYAAQHAILNTQTAIKLLRPERGYSPTIRERFLRESRIIFQLHHPNIVRAIDAGEQDNQYYLVMELLTGADLTHVLATHTFGLNIADACEVIYQATAGLHYLHSRELIHRDIKPSNLYLNTLGTTKILDLGLARSVNFDDDVRLTVTGQVMGTPDFMAPEQCESTHHVDIRADLYSMGCTLYALLAGQPPFFGEGYTSHVKKMHAHLEVTPPDLKLRRPEVPDELVQIVMRLLAKAPADRYQTPQELLLALEPYRVGADLLHLVQHLPGLDSTLDLPSPVQLRELPPTPPATPPAPAELAESPRRQWFCRRNVLIAVSLSAVLSLAAWMSLNGNAALGIAPFIGSSALVTLVEAPPIDPPLLKVVEDGRGGRPDFWEKGVEYDLLAYEPIPVMWINPAPNNCDAIHQVGQRKFSVQTFDEAIFEFAHVNSLNYDYEVTIHSIDWRKYYHSGIVYGFNREDDPKSRLFGHYSSVICEYHLGMPNVNKGPSWSLCRMAMILRREADPKLLCSPTKTIYLQSTTIPSPNTAGLKLTMQVRDGVIQQLRHNNVPCESLLVPMDNVKELFPHTTTGGIGIIVYSNAIISNARLRILE